MARAKARALVMARAKARALVIARTKARALLWLELSQGLVIARAKPGTSYV